MSNRFDFNVQWHITTNCSNKCKHCYMINSPNYLNERNNTLTPEQRIEVLDEFDRFCLKHNAIVNRFHITGGDPLLADGWYDFLVELRRRNKIIRMMGNPETATDETLSLLADLKVQAFQMSLDGLEETHDKFRSPGSFQRTIDKIQLFKKYGIPVAIMFTLYPNNAHELIPLLRYVAEHTETSIFRFDIGCYAEDNKINDKPFSAKEIYQLFSLYFQEEIKLKKEGYKIKTTMKSSLGNLIKYEHGLVCPPQLETNTILTGCAIGKHIAILSDGTVYACRRMPIKAGKLPEQSLEEIYFDNIVMKKARRPEYHEECNSCSFLSICQGCPAYHYSINKNMFGKNPLCFKDLISKKVETTNFVKSNIPLNVSHDEERKLLASQIDFHKKGESFLKHKYFQDIFFGLKFSLENRKEFIASPENYLKKMEIELTKTQIAWLVYFFSVYNSLTDIRHSPILNYSTLDFDKETTFYRPDFIRPQITYNDKKITIKYYNKEISLDIDAKKLIEKMYQVKEFTGQDLLTWDDEYSWEQIFFLISVLLTQHIIFISEQNKDKS